MISRSMSKFSGLLLACLIASVLILASGCKSAPTPTATTPATAAGVSFSKDIQPVFNTSCVACHQGARAPAGLNLESGSAHANLVNVKASEAAALNRVTPGAADKSYLVNKLLGTQAQVGGSGGQMPFNGAPLIPAQISLIQQWITQGAPDN